MIGKLTGKITDIYEDSIIIDVSGVGYLVFLSSKSIEKISADLQATLFIETIVREELINLYGFSSSEEKKIFNLLIQVSGVGPRVALSILSYLTIDEIIHAINFKEKEYFQKVSGIGPKVAERIILELKTKISKLGILTSSNISSVKSSDAMSKSIIISDAISALSNLGISKNDANTIVSKIMNDNPDISLDDLIKTSLKMRGF